MSHDLDALPRSGAVSRALAKWFFRAARVTDVAKLSPRFRLFTLRGEQLRALAWEPGQKVQIVVGPGMTWRTYTPITWDPDAGQTRLLGFRHGEGPASQWLAKLAAGTDCAVFGHAGRWMWLRRLPTSFFSATRRPLPSPPLCGRRSPRVPYWLYSRSRIARRRRRCSARLVWRRQS